VEAGITAEEMQHVVLLSIGLSAFRRQDERFTWIHDKGK
jgi:hypothetical protein